MADFESFKSCLAAQARLDAEAIDIMWVQPIKDIVEWWNRQADATKKYLDLVFGGIAGGSIGLFLKRLFPGLPTAAGEVLGGAIIATGLGLLIVALVDCGINDL